MSSGRAIVVLGALALVACSSSSPPKTAPQPDSVPASVAVNASSAPVSGADSVQLAAPVTSPQKPPATGPVDLRGVCPDPVVIQADWNPEAEHGGVYNLLGAGYTVDKERQRVTGPLVAGRLDTGIKVEIRSGGPAVSFTPVPVVMYRSPEIFLGFVGTDDAIEFAGTAPTVALVAPLERSPMMVMWSPEQHPTVQTISDLKKDRVPVRYFDGEPYMQYFLDQGIVDAEQVDSSYDGQPNVFVAENGRIAQQGFASSEPYLYEKLIDGWKKPVKYQLVHDAGWQPYAQSLSVRPEVIEPLTPCLDKLIPIVQQSQVDFVDDPARTTATILDLVAQYDNGWTYSDGMSAYSVETQRSLGLVGNGDTPALGDLDPARVNELISIARPIFVANDETVPDGLSAADIIDNRFIDPSITLK